MVREALKERDEILKRSLKEAEQLKADSSRRRAPRASQIVKRAKDQIEREKSLAIQELRTQVADIAVEAASQDRQVLADAGRAEEARQRLHHRLPKVVQ
jgi:F-type H+-transporting ATPase subunit b